MNVANLFIVLIFGFAGVAAGNRGTTWTDPRSSSSMKESLPNSPDDAGGTHMGRRNGKDRTPVDAFTIRRAQAALNSRGIRVEVNGQMTTEMKNALLRFQADNGLTETGALDQATIAELGIAHGQADTGTSPGTGTGEGVNTGVSNNNGLVPNRRGPESRVRRGR